MSSYEVCNIRGALGTQLLSILYYACALGPSFRKKSFFQLNIAGYSPENMLYAVADSFKVTQLLNIPIAFVDGTNKAPVFREPHKLQNVGFFVHHLLPLEEDNQKYGTYLHQRKRDRSLVANEVYDKIREQNPKSTVIGDKMNIASDLNTNLLDWKKLYSAETIIGPYSTFTLSAALYNSNVQLFIIPREHSKGRDFMIEEDWKFVSHMVDNFDNIHWYDKL